MMGFFEHHRVVPAREKAEGEGARIRVPQIVVAEEMAVGDQRHPTVHVCAMKPESLDPAGAGDQQGLSECHGRYATGRETRVGQSG
jgi:hypothetical protein